MDFNVKQLDQLLFVDIETVRCCRAFAELDQRDQELWKKKHVQLFSGSDKKKEESFIDRAGIYAEFGKIICITIGAIERRKNEMVRFKVKSFFGDDERKILKDFFEVINQYYGEPQKSKLCGHNIREFDFPYIARRAMIQGLVLPMMFKAMGQRAWQVPQLIDTMELWKFGDYKNYVSLDLLCSSLNIDSPKDGITGADVGRVYYEQNGLEQIVRYCERDVWAVTQVFLKFLKSAGTKFVESSDFCLK